MLIHKTKVGSYLECPIPLPMRFPLVFGYKCCLSMRIQWKRHVNHAGITRLIVSANHLIHYKIIHYRLLSNKWSSNGPWTNWISFFLILVSPFLLGISFLAWYPLSFQRDLKKSKLQSIERHIFHPSSRVNTL